MKLRSFIFLIMLPVINGCASKLAVVGGLENEKSGVGATLSFGQLPIHGNWHLNGVAGFNTYFIENDADAYAEIGIQGRYSKESTPFWFGSEISYINDISDQVDGFWDSDANANGLSFGALGGYQLPIKSLEIGLSSKVSYVGYRDDVETDYNPKHNHNGLRFSLGLEITLPSF